MSWSWSLRELIGLHLHALAFDGVANGARQPAKLELALDETVLRTLLQGLRGQRFVIHPHEQDQRRAGRHRAHLPHGSQSLGIRQGRIEQDDVRRIFGEIVLGVVHAAEMPQFRLARAFFREHFVKRTEVSWIGFDQNYSDGSIAHAYSRTDWPV